jgi:hypothetical protein
LKNEEVAVVNDNASSPSVDVSVQTDHSCSPETSLVGVDECSTDEVYFDQTIASLLSLEHRVMTRVDYPEAAADINSPHVSSHVPFITAFSNPSLVTPRTTVSHH